MGLPLGEMVRMHPYEYTYFNRIAGGVRAARANYMLDYWGLSLKQASQALAQSSTNAMRRARLTGTGSLRSAARIARRRSSLGPISTPPGIRKAPISR